jgi:hypothetical protein
VTVYIWLELQRRSYSFGYGSLWSLAGLFIFGWNPRGEATALAMALCGPWLDYLYLVGPPEDKLQLRLWLSAVPGWTVYIWLDPQRRSYSFGYGSLRSLAGLFIFGWTPRGQDTASAMALCGPWLDSSMSLVGVVFFIVSSLMEGYSNFLFILSIYTYSIGYSRLKQQ